MSEEMFIATLFLVFTGFELVYPAQKQQSLKGRLRNIGYGVFVLTVGAFLSALVVSLLPFDFYLHKGFTLWQSCLYAIAFIALNDLGFYWYHRAQHKFGALWALHELHHSDDEMNASTSYRTYWLDYPAQALVINVPVLLVLGLDPLGMVFMIGFSILILTFTHANIRLHLGPFARVLVGPQMHRIHHSILPQHRDKNLAQVFPIYDIVFGTYYHPQKDEYPPTGTDTLATNSPYLKTMTRPFETWLNMAQRSR